MSMEVPVVDRDARGGTPGGCPVDHGVYGQRKTGSTVISDGAPVQRDAMGVWHVRGYAEARAVLRSPHTRQAGFKAELIEHSARTMRPPVLYQEGQTHHEQRRQTARFFTPRATSSNYRELMETLSAEIVAEIKRRRRADLSRLSMLLAART
jgi:cytochrome P450